MVCDTAILRLSCSRRSSSHLLPARCQSGLETGGCLAAQFRVKTCHGRRERLLDKKKAFRDPVGGSLQRRGPIRLAWSAYPEGFPGEEGVANLPCRRNDGMIGGGLCKSIVVYAHTTVCLDGASDSWRIERSGSTVPMLKDWPLAGTSSACHLCPPTTVRAISIVIDLRRKAAGSHHPH